MGEMIMEIINEKQIEQFNFKYKNATPLEIVDFALSLSKEAVVTTNFRPYEAAILFATTRIESRLPVVWCDTGYNTPNTYKHAQQLIEKLELNIFLYIPKQTAAYRSAIMGVPSIDHPYHKVFTEQVKLEPFKRAMEFHQPKIWFTNLRKGQTVFRNSIDVFSLDKTGCLKVSPFYHWSDTDLDTYLEEHKLPNEFKYFDPTKALANRECGLHN